MNELCIDCPNLKNFHLNDFHIIKRSDYISNSILSMLRGDRAIKLERLTLFNVISAYTVPETKTKISIDALDLKSLQYLKTNNFVFQEFKLIDFIKKLDMDTIKDLTIFNSLKPDKLVEYLELGEDVSEKERKLHQFLSEKSTYSELTDGPLF